MGIKEKINLAIRSMDLIIRAFSQQAPPLLVLAAGVAILAGMQTVGNRLKRHALENQAQIAALQGDLDDTADALGESGSLRDLKAGDLGKFKNSLAQLTHSRQVDYESGLELQEDERLLEKQWEMVSTYLMIDPETKRINLMRGDQALESYPIDYAPPQAFGADNKPLPSVVRIVSKERFASPERGTSEEVNGQLQWEPPQVGTSVRANALGEYVMFTSGPLILHGPPKKAEEHKGYAHYCLGLSLAVARRLYAKSFIGTKILIKQSANSSRLMESLVGSPSSEAVRR